MKSLNLQERLAPVDRDSGFRMEDFWTWDGSIIEGEDHLYHMFASRWPRKYPMHPSWLFTSEIVRATSKRIEGPYTFQEVVFKKRDKTFFDGRMTHNPSIRKYGDHYVLFYIGATYDKKFPENPSLVPTREDSWYHDTWLSKRIGLAWSRSVTGPWHRIDMPILEPRPGFWDGGITSNPSPCVLPDGSIYLAYKSSIVEGRGFNIGIAKAPHWNAPFQRITDSPCFRLDIPGSFVEDPFLWYAEGSFHMILKDMTGDLAGEYGNGIYACSKDAVTWQFGSPAVCHERTITWNDGVTEIVSNLERLQLLFDHEGQMTHLIAATARARGNLEGVSDAWVNVIPLAQPAPVNAHA